MVVVCHAMAGQADAECGLLRGPHLTTVVGSARRAEADEGHGVSHVCHAVSHVSCVP